MLGLQISMGVDHATSRTALAAYQTAAVNAIRATGGNNATRMIVLQGISASPIAVSVATIPMVDNNIIVSLHTYDPVGFSMNGSPTTWGSASDTAAVMNNLKSESGMVSTKGQVAIVGEWGSVSQDDLASRVHHAQFYARECINHGMVAVWWDDGAGFHILNRSCAFLGLSDDCPGPCDRRFAGGFWIRPDNGCRAFNRK